jgi:D-glycero-D-manno-heptose 1,7-bisphosphate phosphatase
VITNQAGIGRGYYTEADFQRLTDWMLGEFRKRDIELGRVYHCPYHPTEGIGAYRQESRDRKPNPGMILKAQQDFGLDLARSVLIGDKDSDMAAGRSGGIRHLLKLVHPSEINNGRTEEGVLQVDTLSSATNWFETTFR